MAQNYSVQRFARNGIQIVAMQQADLAHVEIVPEWGNNCFQFQTTAPVLEPVSFDDFALRPFSFGIPILFPFPNRIKDGKFFYAGHKYEVIPKQHGFVRTKKWAMLESGASDNEGAWILSELNAETYPHEILDQFPFPFRLSVLYRLRNARLDMETTVRNTGGSTLPFGFGIHPYFRLPESGTLRIPAQKHWELKNFIPTGKQLNVKGQYDLREPRDVHSLSLDDIFTDLQPVQDNMVRCILEDDTDRIRTIVQFDVREFPHVVVYTAPPPRRAIAIEPYTCPTDAFNLQNSGVPANVLELQPGQESKFLISIYTERV